MPEIGEVARIVNYIHKNLVGKSLAVVKAQHDENVFGKVGTSAAEFEKTLTGKKVVDAKQQGKYFWLVMSSPPHPLFHFGMAGWWKIRNLETAYYRPSKPQEDIWPPKYWKFTLETASDDPKQPKSEHAFVDFRRFARIRLVDCAAQDLRNVSPLKENGPDPVLDKDILTEEWLVQKLQSKHIPVKALLLDQANISGIGNWVGDELLFDAKIHPEQYSNTLTPAQMKQLHKSIQYVCSTAVELLAESDKFPEHWLFKHRWGKGKKDDPQRLPNGEKIKFITVGGRTSAIVPSVQKKTGEVAGDIDDDENEGNEKPKSTKRKAPKKEAEDDEEPVNSDSKPRKASKSKKKAVKEEPDNDDPDQANSNNVPIREQPPPSKKAKGKVKTEAKNSSHASNKANAPRTPKTSKAGVEPKAIEETDGLRRSTRVSAAAR
ncbi:MAG: hypothetical protein Q9211_003927 [Gyalolechia sp. 1 TL-2023]